MFHKAVAAALVLGLLSINAARAAVSYTITPLNFSAADINDAGQIAGSQAGQAIRWHNGVTTPLGNLGASPSASGAINSVGDIGGQSNNGSGQTQGFRYIGAGPMQAVPFLANAPSFINGINASGAVAGEGRNASDQTRGFIYDGSMHELAPFSGAFSIAFDINDAGQATGWASASGGGSHAFRTSGYTPIDLGVIGGAQSSYGIAINQAGQVSGALNYVSSISAMYHDGTTMHDIGNLGGPEAWALDLNDVGQIVGWSYTPTATHAFIHSGGTMVDLNDLIDPLSGWELFQADAINNAGQIIGTGNQGTFLLTPVPEPAALGCASLALLLLGRRRTV